MESKNLTKKLYKKKRFAHSYFMEKINCGNAKNFDILNNFFECGTCGNHVCKAQAELWGRVCPNCFGKLYRIS